MALLQLLLILTPTSVSLPSVNLSPPLSAVASSLPLPRSEACICQHHITLHLGVSKHACDMTQRNTPVENILLREHMGRGAQWASKRGSNTHGEESLKGKLRQRRNEEEDEVVGRER